MLTCFSDLNCQAGELPLQYRLLFLWDLHFLLLLLLVFHPFLAFQWLDLQGHTILSFCWIQGETNRESEWEAELKTKQKQNCRRNRERRKDGGERENPSAQEPQQHTQTLCNMET